VILLILKGSDLLTDDVGPHIETALEYRARDGLMNYPITVQVKFFNNGKGHNCEDLDPHKHRELLKRKEFRLDVVAGWFAEKRTSALDNSSPAACLNKARACLSQPLASIAILRKSPYVR
jgi:hypothetical protein